MVLMDADLERLLEWESVLPDLEAGQKRFEEFEEWLRVVSEFYPPFLRTLERMKQVRRSFDEKADEIRWWVKQITESSEEEPPPKRPRLPSPVAGPKKMPMKGRADLS